MTVIILGHYTETEIMDSLATMKFPWSGERDTSKVDLLRPEMLEYVATLLDTEKKHLVAFNGKPQVQ
jgi:hypothetical protein